MKFANILLAGFLFSFSACFDGSTNSCVPVGQTKGFGYSPRGFPESSQYATEFYVEIQNLRDAGIFWSGLWRDDLAGSDAGRVPTLADEIVEKSRTYCYMPTVVFRWRDQNTLYIGVPANPDNSWLNQEAKNAFLTMLTRFVSEHRAPYIFLGHENDFYYQDHLLDYEQWIAFYNQAYDTIKEISPATQVGPTFNFEHIAGSGLAEGWVTPYWEALLRHDQARVDIVGLTLYPFFHVTNPNQVPANYLSPLFEKIGNKAVAILETGWPATNSAGTSSNWEVGEPLQADYIRTLTSILTGRNIAMVNWKYLYEPGDALADPMSKAFPGISLKTKTNTPRLAYDEWVSLGADSF